MKDLPTGKMVYQVRPGLRVTVDWNRLRALPVSMLVLGWSNKSKRLHGVMSFELTENAASGRPRKSENG